jgi:hypothetical protein
VGDGPTQHSITKSRVSLAQVMSLGRSSGFYTQKKGPAVRVRADFLKTGGGGEGRGVRGPQGRTGDHFCDGSFGKGEVIVTGRDPGMTFTV